MRWCRIGMLFVLVALLLAATFGVWYFFLGPSRMATPRLILRCSESECICVAFSPDSKYLAVGQRDGGVKIWETAQGAPWFEVAGKPAPGFELGASVFSIEFSPNGDILAWGGGDRKVTLLD